MEDKSSRMRIQYYPCTGGGVANAMGVYFKAYMNGPLCNGIYERPPMTCIDPESVWTAS